MRWRMPFRGAARNRGESAPIVGNQIVEGSLRSVMIALVLPVLAEQLLNTLVGLVDTWLAGNFTTDPVAATSAVGLASYVSWLVMMLFGLVGIGTTALVSRAFGADDKVLASRVANQSLMLAGFIGLAVGVALMLLAAPFARWQSFTGETYNIAVRYLRIDAIGHAASALTLIGAAALRGSGDMRTPMKIFIVVNVFNIVLSPMLVRGVGGLPEFGVDGIVAGTLCARISGAMIMFFVLLRGDRRIALHIQQWKPDGDTIRRILRIGLPAAADGAMIWAGHFVFLMIVGKIAASAASNASAYAAHIVVVRLEAFTYLPAGAWSAACATMIGQALGANLPARAVRAGKEGAMQCGLLTAVIGLFFVAYAEHLCGLMNSKPEVIRHAAPVLILAGMFQPALAMSIVFVGALRGAGDSVGPMILNAISLAVVRVPGGYLLGLYFGWGLMGAWIAVCADFILRMILNGWRFYRAAWTRKRI